MTRLTRLTRLDSLYFSVRRPKLPPPPPPERAAAGDDDLPPYGPVPIAHNTGGATSPGHLRFSGSNGVEADAVADGEVAVVSPRQRKLLESGVARRAQQRSQKNILVLTNGNGDCCAWHMGRVTSYAEKTGMDVVHVAWSNFKEYWTSGLTGLDTAGKDRYVRTGREYLQGLPTGTNIYMIGHSWGADSSYRLVNAYDGLNVNFRLLALIDTVGPGPSRSNHVSWRIPSKVDYFFNRWQKNFAWPIDFKKSGEFSNCQAKTCDQSENNFSRNPDGSNVYEKCQCPGEFCSTGVSWSSPCGKKMKRVSHEGIAEDGFIETQLISIIERLQSENTCTGNCGLCSFHEGCDGFEKSRSPECVAATSRFCKKVCSDCGGVIQQVNGPGGVFGVSCFRGKENIVPIYTLRQLHPGCNHPSLSQSNDCIAAVSRWCFSNWQGSNGFPQETGGIPQEVGIDALAVSCFDASWYGEMSIETLNAR